MKTVFRTPRQALKRWIKALESGEYKQGQRQLAQKVLDDENRPTGMSFCCLGVLCDLAAKDGGRQWGQEVFEGDAFPRYEVTGYVGLNTLETSLLTQMNDSAGKSFKEIAAWLREHILPRV